MEGQKQVQAKGQKSQISTKPSQKQAAQKDQKVQKGQSQGLNIQFQFPQLRKLLKVTAPFRSTIKAHRPFFAMKMDYDFAHMQIRAIVKQTKQEISTLTPLQQINYFKQKRELYTIQIRIIYEGG